MSADVSSMIDAYDVAVIGAGPAGFGAAIAAAQQGARTILLERHVIPGGMGTVALVNNFCPAHLDGTRLIIGGVFGKLRQRLIAKRALYSAADDASSISEVFDPVAYAAEMNAMLAEFGVTCLYGQRSIEIEFEKESALCRLSAGKKIHAYYVIDATGDAAIAASAGVDFKMGRPSDGAVMPLTYCFAMGPINIEALRAALPDAVRHDERMGEDYCCILSHAEINRRLLEARKRNEIHIPLDRVPGIISIPGRPEIVTVNFGRVECKDPTQPDLLARASEIGLKQIEEAIAFLQDNVPGFEKAQLTEVARQIGVRQSRQIMGLYELTAKDCVDCRQFDDVIAQCSYSLDIHEPGRDSITLIRFKNGTHYDIPWRCLIPARGPSNLIVAGRSISCSAEAMSSLRVSPSAMAIGEASGVTAALAAKTHRDIRDVDWREVQQHLKQNGAILS